MDSEREDEVVEEAEEVVVEEGVDLIVVVEVVVAVEEEVEEIRAMEIGNAHHVIIKTSHDDQNVTDVVKAAQEVVAAAVAVVVDIAVEDMGVIAIEEVVEEAGTEETVIATEGIDIRMLVIPICTLTPHFH